MSTPLSFFWFRRDLRLEDNAGLYHALRSGSAVQPVFIFDSNILNDLEDKTDRRVQFIYEAVEKLHRELQAMGSSLWVLFGKPDEVWKKLLVEHPTAAIYTNHDYEPYALQRDGGLKVFFDSKKIPFHTFKDQVIFEKDEVLKDDGKPYTVFTPYSRKWKLKLTDFYAASYPTEKYFSNFHQQSALPIPSLESIGFQKSNAPFSPANFSKEIVANYHLTRDFPSIAGTSQLSVHLRFGTVSIRKILQQSLLLNEKFSNELIWRDFYQMILWHFPTVVHESFKKEYDYIQWRNNQSEFDLWCQGQTGYPLVDAGMRQLNETGWMHNRVRMVVASFLTKHLLIDWRWGETYFAKKLLDFDLASNNGGWQWAAGCGCDAAPYFRVFNPTLQAKQYDADLKYIRRWVPEFQTLNYPQPIVEHTFARERVLKVYAAALKGKN